MEGTRPSALAVSTGIAVLQVAMVGLVVKPSMGARQSSFTATPPAQTKPVGGGMKGLGVASHLNLSPRNTAAAVAEPRTLAAALVEQAHGEEKVVKESQTPTAK
jgi:hypothetical protein